MTKTGLWFAERLGPTFIRTIGRTLRTRFLNPEVEQNLLDQGGLIYSFWHRWMLVPAYTHRKRGVTVMISRHRDGEIISRIVHRLGFRSARGSTTRGGAKALLELGQVGRRGDCLAITPDGPRGPNKSVAPGIVHLSARTGLPILPSGLAVSRARDLELLGSLRHPQTLQHGRHCVCRAHPVHARGSKEREHRGPDRGGPARHDAGGGAGRELASR